MARKKSTAPHFYGLVESSRLNALPVEVAETGTVRMGLLLEVIAASLDSYPEARQALVDSIALRLGSNSDTRILP